MGVTISIKNKELYDQLAKQAENELLVYRGNLRLMMARSLQLLEVAIKQNIRVRSGLHVRSGTLLNSIVSEVQDSGTSITGTIGPRNVPYAAVHEFGHNFKAREVVPRNAKVLHWVAGGKSFFATRVKIPAFRVPARPYLRPALEEQAEKIRDKFGLFLSASFTFGGQGKKEE